MKRRDRLIENEKHFEPEKPAGCGLHRTLARRGSLKGSLPGGRNRPGFTLMEVLMALTVLSIVLISIYQSFANMVFIHQATEGLWKAMVFSGSELAKVERGPTPQVSVGQGEYPEAHAMSGFRWKKEVKDEEPFPGVRVRKVVFELSWKEGASRKSFSSQTYVPIPK